MQDPILIAGSGAMACLFAAHLAASGYAVTLLGGWEEGVATLNRHGVRLVREGETIVSFSVQAISKPPACPAHRLALVLVKSWQTRQAGEKLSACLLPNASILTLQNGLGNLETLSEVLGDREILCGATTLGATLIAPGMVKACGTGEVILPDLPSSTKFAGILAGSSIPVRLQKDLSGILWGKLLINSAINPLTALLDVPNGFLIENEHALRLVHSIVDEGCLVARSGDIHLPFKNPIEYVEQIILSTAQNSSSMRQDLKRGTLTEIDAINGKIIASGLKWGVKTPFNSMIYHLIKARLSAKQ
ncbi:MAG: 2-dehydropantoate 2-reductase [Anaerolineaceae bacterium]|nr:2-dehydropantoate 2-reductase [Anaerolineaceae bacterium]